MATNMIFSNKTSKSLKIAVTILFIGAASCQSQFSSNHNVIEPWIGEGKTSVLVDSIHQWEARPDFILDEYEFRYAHSQSSNRLLNNLTAHDFKWRQIREGELDYKTLKKHDILFFNVPTRVPGGRSKPDRKLPVLSAKEIQNIVRYVEEGGGLFVISEHNNAYDNAEVLNPLLKHFDIQIPASYARDKPLSQYTIGNTSILIRISNYKEHPVTRKLRETSWLGGGPLETEHGIAFLSENGHSDLGNYISHVPSKHSNRKVDKGELTGADIPLFAAMEHGKGRVVVMGDHNVMGIQWLGIADNYRLGMNIFAWLSQRENETPHMADAPPIGVKLGWDLSHTDWTPGLRDRRGYHPGFINFSRIPQLFSMGLLDLDDPTDILLFADPEAEFSADDLKSIQNRLARAQRIIILMDPAEPQAGTIQLLETLLPGLAMKTPKGIFLPSQARIGATGQIPRAIGSAPIYSATLNIKGTIVAGALDPRRTSKKRYAKPKKLYDSTTYLLDVQIDQGAPFISAKLNNGREVTVARRFSVENGEIILFVQGRMWGNETFGPMRDEPETDAAYGAHDLQLRFGKWLAKMPPVIAPDGGKLIPYPATFEPVNKK